MARTFSDNSVAPIIAIDFDGTIGIGDSYPNPKHIRKYAKDVINFMIDSGIKVIIYTSRDVAIDQNTYSVHDDITPMIKFLNANGVKYSAINKSVQFAPWVVNSRKVYAHMYVDDRAFGWVESKCVMLYILHDFLVRVCNIHTQNADKICGAIYSGEDYDKYAMMVRKHIGRIWH